MRQHFCQQTSNQEKKSSIHSLNLQPKQAAELKINKLVLVENTKFIDSWRSFDAIMLQGGLRYQRLFGFGDAKTNGEIVRISHLTK